MQLVVRLEKADPPTRSAVCEATAKAVVELLTAPETLSGEWADPVRHWESGPIRKVTRRARGVRWPEVRRLPGVTVRHRGAEVRAFVPGPVDQVPPELARLQVAGLDLPGEDIASPAVEPPRPFAAVVLNPAAAMSTGKAAAQCGHAAHLLLRRSSRRDAAAWKAAGLEVRLLAAPPWEECAARAEVTVRDAGHTEVAPGTMTVAAWLVR